MKFTKHYSIAKGQLNITPLIDVVFLMLIYFMLTSTFILQPGIKIDLPQAVTAEQIEEKELIVGISEEGMIFYGDIPVNIDQLEAILSQESREKTNITLIVQGDKKAEHGIVVKVMDIARRNGINKIAIATMPEF